jgi:hypothetical protein
MEIWMALEMKKEERKEEAERKKEEWREEKRRQELRIEKEREEKERRRDEEIFLRQEILTAFQDFRTDKRHCKACTKVFDSVVWRHPESKERSSECGFEAK